MAPIALDDVFSIAWFGGGGYGDPLERDANAVAVDVQEGLVTQEHARSAYGVVFESGTVAAVPLVDARATGALRAELRGRRIGGMPMAAPPPPTLRAGHRWLDANITLAPDEVAHCGRCGHVVAGAGENYKTGLRMIERDLAESGRVWHDPSMYCDDVDLVFREFVCPRCATLIEVETAFRGDAPLRDKELAPVNAKAGA